MPYLPEATVFSLDLQLMTKNKDGNTVVLLLSATDDVVSDANLAVSSVLVKIMDTVSQFLALIMLILSSISRAFLLRKAIVYTI